MSDPLTKEPEGFWPKLERLREQQDSKAKEPVSKAISMVEVTCAGQRPQIVLTFENLDEMHDASDRLRELRTPQGEPALTQSAGLLGTREPAVIEPKGNTGESPASTSSNQRSNLVGRLDVFIKAADEQPKHEVHSMPILTLMREVRAFLASDETTSRNWPRRSDTCELCGGVWIAAGKHHIEHTCVLSVDRPAVEPSAPRCEAQSPGTYTSKRCDLARGHDGPHVATEGRVTDKWQAEKASARPVPACANPVMVTAERYRGCVLPSGHEGECSAQNGGACIDDGR